MIYGKLDVHLVEPSECLDWHKVPKICDSQCLVFMEFKYLVHIINIKKNNS